MVFWIHNFCGLDKDKMINKEEKIGCFFGARKLNILLLTPDKKVRYSFFYLAL
jgi:hypothetical protein